MKSVYCILILSVFMAKEWASSQLPKRPCALKTSCCSLAGHKKLQLPWFLKLGWPCKASENLRKYHPHRPTKGNVRYPTDLLRKASQQLVDKESSILRYQHTGPCLRLKTSMSAILEMIMSVSLWTDASQSRTSSSERRS